MKPAKSEHKMPFISESPTTILIRRNQSLAERGEPTMMFPGEKRFLKAQEFVAMPTPEGVDGCSRCHWRMPANCIREKVIDTLGSCTGGKRVYFAWCNAGKCHAKPSFQPVQLDEPDGLGY